MHNHGKGIKGILMMILCMGGPVTAMLLLVLSRSGAVTLPVWLPYTLFLLCPLSHILMIPLMKKPSVKDGGVEDDGGKSGCH